MKNLLVVSLLAAGAIAQAQSPSPSAVAHAPDGGVREMLQSISILPLMNAPFSATVTTEWTKILADGSTATVKNHRTVARDSTGRIFEERRYFSPNGDQAVTRLSALEYTDPSRHEFYSCIPQEKTCYLHKYGFGPLMKMPDGMTGARACNCAGPRIPGATEQEQALGQNTIEDVEVTGSREILMLNPELVGNKDPQPLVKEFWYSPRLGLNLVTKRFDPRFGSQNFLVNHLSLGEPDSTMFQPPADYRVVQEVVVKQASTPQAPPAP